VLKELAVFSLFNPLPC